MPGIYLHIPFCKKACHYCDFHFSTSITYKKEMLEALVKEITLQKHYFEGPIETIYFGGGTPSLLDADEIQRLLDAIYEVFTVSPQPEITLEANPDDLDPARVRALKHTAVNRFSIGIQSFFDEDLRWMNRAHTANEAESAVKRVQDAGFENITADLIYGYPLLTNEKWQQNTEKVVNFEIPHLSAYAMTVEARTPLASFINKGKQPAMDEQQSAGQLIALIAWLEQSGYEHYEISNFCRPGQHSRHNSNYWNGIPYLGVGPSAHSFNGTSRQWNVANNAKYIDSLTTGQIPFELETLTAADQLNEYLMTGLRTSKGIDRAKISARFGDDYLAQIESEIESFLQKGWVSLAGNSYVLTPEGKLFADRVASGVMII